MVTTQPDPDGRRWGVSSPRVVTLVEGYLADAATRTHARLGDVVGVALTTAVDGGEPLTAGASSSLAAEVDHLQYTLGRGPCLDALRGGGEAYVADLAHDVRWGRYGPEAAALGARSCFSVPVLDEGAGVLGVVKVYAGRVDGLDEAQRRTVRAFALEVAGGAGLANTLVATVLELDDRADAMDTRRTIDLATGVLMGRLGCSSEAAFDLLRRESQNHNVKVTDVAADLLSRTSAPAGTVGTAGPDGTAEPVWTAGPAWDGVPEQTTAAPRTALRAPFRRRGEAPARGR